jgi:hypothetical protein
MAPVDRGSDASHTIFVKAGRRPKRQISAVMNRTLLSLRIKQADAHVARGEEIVRRQRDIVAELDRDGHNSRLARELLSQFERLQHMHLADRVRLIKETAR